MITMLSTRTVLIGAAAASITIGMVTTYMSASVTQQDYRHLMDSQNDSPFAKPVTMVTNETGESDLSKLDGSRSWKLETPINSAIIATPSARKSHANQDSRTTGTTQAPVTLPTSSEPANGTAASPTQRLATSTTSPTPDPTTARQKREEEIKAIQEEIKQKEQEKNQSAKGKGDKPNILLLYGDDWTLKTLGVLNKAVKTPNLDKMSQNGMLFTHNCVTTSICMVSRATLYTGQYASRHKTFSQNHREMFAPGVWNETLWPLLGANGYHTGLMGKWHHLPPPKGTFTRSRFYADKHYIEQKRDGKNATIKHITKWNEEDALRFLKQRPVNKPFALMVSFYAIHAEDFGTEKYRPQNESMSLYVDDVIPTPKTATEKHYQDLPPFFHNHQNYARGRWKGRYSNPELYQKMMKNMYRMVSEVDTTCGKILNKLEEQGVLNNTIVIFTTDNGNLHGEHGLAEKWFAFEESIRVPLIIQDPRMPEDMVGTRNDDFTLNIDLAPTILSAAGIPVPEVMQGRDMSDLYMKREDESTVASSKPWRDEFYYEWLDKEGSYKENLPQTVALVRKNSKYISWPDHDYEQLFRLDNDPFEEIDLFSSNLTTDQNMLKDMRTQMTKLAALAESGLPM